MTNIDAACATVLGYLYVVLFLVVLVQILRIVFYRHRFYSFQGGFLSICLCWTGLRFVFWLFCDLNTWPIWLSDFLYVLPTVFECAMFSLLILFYAKLADPKHWASQRADLATAYALANLTMLVLTILFAGFNDQAEHSDAAVHSSVYLDKVFFISSGTYFGVLVMLASYYVYVLLSTMNSAVRRSKQTILVTFLVFVIFLTRCIFDFISAFAGITRFHIYSADRDGSHGARAKHLPPVALLLFLVWEVVPTVMVLVYFRSIPATNLGMFPATRRKLVHCCARRFPACFRWCCVPDDALTDEDDAAQAILGRSFASEDAISPVLGKVRVYRDPSGDNVHHSCNSGQSFQSPPDHHVGGRRRASATGSQPHSTNSHLGTHYAYASGGTRRNPTGDLFDDPHRYSLTPDDQGTVAAAPWGTDPRRGPGQLQHSAGSVQDAVHTQYGYQYPYQHTQSHAQQGADRNRTLSSHYNLNDSVAAISPPFQSPY